MTHSALARSTAELLAEGQRAFADARGIAGGEDVDLLIAGREVRVRFAGQAARPWLLRALQTRPGGTGEPTLELMVWEGADTGVPLRLASSVTGAVGRLGLVEARCDERYRVAIGDTVFVLDRQAGQAVLYVPDVGSLPYWERAHPARLLMAAWATSVGLRMMHAAAVGNGRAGLLVIGSSGSGKSTLALCCLASGLRCAGDDYVLVEPGPRPQAYSLYASALLHEEHRGRWPALMPAVANAERLGHEEKAVTFFSPDQLTQHISLSALALPQLSGSASPGVRTSTPTRALRALAPSSLLQLGDFDPTSLTELSELCRSLPCLELRLPCDVAAIPALVRQVLSLLGPPESAPGEER